MKFFSSQLILSESAALAFLLLGSVCNITFPSFIFQAFNVIVLGVSLTDSVKVYTVHLIRCSEFCLYSRRFLFNYIFFCHILIYFHYLILMFYLVYHGFLFSFLTLLLFIWIFFFNQFFPLVVWKSYLLFYSSTDSLHLFFMSNWFYFNFFKVNLVSNYQIHTEKHANEFSQIVCLCVTRTQTKTWKISSKPETSLLDPSQSLFLIQGKLQFSLLTTSVSFAHLWALYKSDHTSLN